MMELPDPDHGIAVFVGLEERDHRDAIEHRRDRVGETHVMRENGRAIDGEGCVVSLQLTPDTFH